MKSIYTILILVILNTCCLAQSTYIQEFGVAANADANFSLCDKGNGEVLTLGHQTGAGTTTWDMFYLNHFDKNGNNIKSKELGYVVNHKGKIIKKTKDGGYILGGEGKWCTGLSCGNDGMLVKLNSNLGLEWSCAIGGLFPIDDIMDIEETTNGYYVLANAGSPTSGLDFSVTKLTLTGDTTWIRNFSSYASNPNSEDEAMDMVALANGDFVVLGNAYDASNTSYDNIFLLKGNANGQILWTKIAKGLSFLADNLVALNDGYLFSTSWGVLNKVDVNGNLLWQKNFASGLTYPTIYKLQQSISGDILMCGTENSNATISKLKTDGSLIFSKRLNIPNSSLVDIVELSDGRIAACGQISSGSTSQCLLVTADGEGNIGANCQSPLNMSFANYNSGKTFVNYSFSPIPSPTYLVITATNSDITSSTNHSFNASCKNNYTATNISETIHDNDIQMQEYQNIVSIQMQKTYDVTIFSILGHTIVNAPNNIGRKSFALNTAAKGVYLVLVKSGNKYYKKKISIE